MSDQPALGRTLGARFFLRFGITAAVALAVVVFAIGSDGLRSMAARFASAHPHPPDWSLIARAPLIIQLHLVSVLAAFGVATVQMVGPKGTIGHRVMGWVYVVFMGFTALDALFIRDGATWRFTPIQIFSVIVLAGLPTAVLAARRHQVAAHARGMTGLYVGALILAGIFTFTPGRLLWRVFFG